MNCSYPDFVNNRVDKYYDERVKSWDGRYVFNSPIPPEEAIVVCTNDYLCIGNHPKILEAQTKALWKSSKDMMSGIFLNEHDGIQGVFEHKMATYLGYENCILSTSGWDANVGLIQCIAHKNVPIYIDTIAHMSLYEGARASGGIIYPFAHNSAEHLEVKIKTHGQGIIVVDSIYSSNGSFCELREITDLAVKYNCVMVVDESHSLGLFGPQGAGLVAELNLSDKVHFITASLSKAFCGRGGIITCASKFKDYFKQASFPAIFSTGAAYHETVRFLTALEIIKEEEWRRTLLHRNSKLAHDSLDQLNFNTEVSKSQIIALEVKSEKLALQIRDMLIEKGIYTAPFIPPATAKKRCIARITLHSDLTIEQIDHICLSCKEVSQMLSTHKQNAVDIF